MKLPNLDDAPHPTPSPPLTLQYQTNFAPTLPPGWTNVRIYGLLPEGLPLLIRSRLAAQISLQLSLALAIAAAFTWLNRSDRLFLILFAALYVPVQLGSLAFGIWRFTSRARREWPHLRILLSDQGLRRVLPGYPDITILNHEIKSIHQTRHGLIIKSPRRLITISIPAAAEHFSEIRAHLLTLQPLSPLRFLVFRFLGSVLLGLLIFSAAFGTYALGLFSPLLWLELLCFLATSAIWTWVLIINFRNPNLRLVQKLALFWFYIFPLSLLAKILFTHLHLHL